MDFVEFYDYMTLALPTSPVSTRFSGYNVVDIGTDSDPNVSLHIYRKKHMPTVGVIRTRVVGSPAVYDMTKTPIKLKVRRVPAMHAAALWREAKADILGLDELVGYDEGGAAATVLAISMRSGNVGRLRRLVTFGEPMSCDRKAVSELEGFDATRIVAQGDLFVMTPWRPLWARWLRMCCRHPVPGLHLLEHGYQRMTDLESLRLIPWKRRKLLADYNTHHKQLSEFHKPANYMRLLSQNVHSR